MKWWQAQELGGIIGAMVAGMGLFLFQANTSLGLLLVLMFVGLLVGRWTGKWLHAIGKWYLRGSRGRRHVTCPGCGRRIWRRKRHWILRCENCGWKPGWPIVRWFWESVPARALRVHGPTFRQIAKAFVLIFITTILVGASIGTGFQAIDQPAQRRADQILNSSVDGKVQTPEAVSTTEDRSEHCNLVESTSKKNEINTKSNQLEVRRGPYPTVEQYFIRFLNRERRERGLSRVSHWQTLSKLAREHSLNMAEHGYIGHTEPDGDTIKDRYQAIGIFGQCGWAAENAAYNWIKRDVRLNGTTWYIQSKKELARALFVQWMNSPPHRRAMLSPKISQVGLGLVISDEGKVYATLNMC